nr:3,6-anhydro-alpha-L-galactonate cycloisomerase-like [Nerophis lumbriciformis]
MAVIEGISATILDSRDLINVVVQIIDTDGVEGVGESWWGIADNEELARAGRPMASVVNDLIAPRVIGRDAEDIDGIWAETANWGYRYGDQGLFTMGLAGVDLALWDLRGQRAGRSVCDLLGGPLTDSLPAYASLPWFRSADLVLRETARAVDAGFTAVKLHETDPEFTSLLRKQFGEDLVIMVDVNGHFDVPGAIEHGRILADLGVLWFEEPVSPMRDHAAIAQVQRAIDCELGGGENEYTLADFERLLTAVDLSYVQPELTKIGGLTPGRAIAESIARHGRSLCPHNFRLGPSCAASIHWAFASPGSSWIELPWFPADKQFSHPMEIPPLVDGCVGVPDGPGFGLGPLA